MATLFLIDAMALAYRSFYALIRSGGLTTSRGVAVSVPYGGARFIHKLIKEQQPDYMALIGESPTTKTFRHEIYSGYKAKRATMPELMEQQLPLFYELFDCFGIKRLEQEGYEADDIIGTLAKRFTGVEVYIVSQDKDFMQLVGDNVYIFNKDYQVLGVEAVQEKFSCQPTQIIDYLALTGDASDEVPGVRGIGPKTAGDLIGKFGSLAEVYANIDQITPAGTQKKLRNGQDSAYLSRKLVTIDTAVPLTTSLEELRYQATNLDSNQRLYDFYRRLEFEQLLQENFSNVVSFVSRKKKNVSVNAKKTVLQEASTVPELKEYLLEVASLKKVTIEIITSSKDPMLLKQIVVGNCRLLVLIDTTKEEMRDSYQLVAGFLADPSLTKIGYDLKRIIKILAKFDIVLGGELRDVMVYDYLLNPNTHNHCLSAICQRYLADESYPSRIEQQMLAVTELVEILGNELTSQGMTSVARELEMPLIRVLAEMELAGIFLDVRFLENYGQELAVGLATLERDIYDEAGEKFNINSPKQLQRILFDKLQIPRQLGIRQAIPRTKTGYSTRDNVLQMLVEHPLAELLIRYRELAKLKNTYIDALPRHVNHNTGRLHTNFRQEVAATGRLSSDNPNLQNIPMRTLLGKKIRRAFRGQGPDSFIVSADYSQVEIRLLASLARAEGLIKDFNSGVDVHRLTAAKVLGIDSEQVTDEQRSQAKAINFGIIYGMGARKLARVTDTSVAEAQKFIDRYFAVYPEIKIFTEDLIQKAINRGYSRTPLGRRRPIIGIKGSNPATYAHARNMAVNSCIQGYAADLIKLAMLKVAKVLRDKNLASKMLLQIHDELVFEIPRQELAVACQTIKDAMERAIVSDVIFRVDIKYGINWLDQEIWR